MTPLPITFPPLAASVSSVLPKESAALEILASYLPWIALLFATHFLAAFFGYMLRSWMGMSGDEPRIEPKADSKPESRPEPKTEPSIP